MSEQKDVERTSRDVIDSKLLAALAEKDVVAIVLSESDLERLIDALSLMAEHEKQGCELLDGLIRLHVEAF